MINEILPFPPFTLLVVLFPFGGIPRQTSSKTSFFGHRTLRVWSFPRFPLHKKKNRYETALLDIGKRDTAVSHKREPSAGFSLRSNASDGSQASRVLISLPRHIKKEQVSNLFFFYGAGNEIRTRDVYLGKVTLYH